MKRFSICCGLTHVDPAAYDGWDGNCPGCDRDAAMAATAFHDGGFDGESVLINRFADTIFMEPAFRGICGVLEPDDLLVLYVSGHGGQMPDTDGDEWDGRDETLCLWSGEVRDDTISEYLQMVPSTARVLLITDTCNSGTMARGRHRARSTPVSIERLKPKKTGGCSVLHVGGCADGRSSFGSDEGGVFTRSFFGVLSAAHKTLTYREWINRTIERVQSEPGSEQVPTFGELGDSFLDREALR